MEPKLKVDFKKEPQLDSFHLQGIIDAHADQHLEDVVRKVSSDIVHLDFSKVGRINSMGIALLLRSIKSMKVEKKAEIQISGLNQINSILFKMTGIFLLAREIKQQSQGA
jgi:anti-anti-sigma regulatory factor